MPVEAYRSVLDRIRFIIKDYTMDLPRIVNIEPKPTTLSPAERSHNVRSSTGAVAVL